MVCVCVYIHRYVCAAGTRVVVSIVLVSSCSKPRCLGALLAAALSEHVPCAPCAQVQLKGQSGVRAIVKEAQGVGRGLDA